jgi:Ner family transcriptional regulator
MEVVNMYTPVPPQKTEERQVWIMAMLRIKKSSYSAIARELGVSRSAVRKAVRYSYPKMERAIAAKIGYAPELIWPERYQAP